MWRRLSPEALFNIDVRANGHIYFLSFGTVAHGQRQIGCVAEKARLALQKRRGGRLVRIMGLATSLASWLVVWEFGAEGSRCYLFPLRLRLRLCLMTEECLSIVLAVVFARHSRENHVGRILLGLSSHARVFALILQHGTIVFLAHIELSEDS